MSETSEVEELLRSLSMGARHLSEVELTEYADGELAAERLGGVEAHLRHCPSCATSLAGLRKAVKAASRMADERAPSSIRQRAAAVLTDPSLSISCKQAMGMMHEQVDRRLSPLAAVPLELHLHACQRCQEELASVRRTTRLVRNLPSVEAPARVRLQVLAAYGQRTRRAFGTPGWRPAIAAAFAVLVIGAAALVKPPVTPTRPQIGAEMTERPTRLQSPPVEVAAIPAAPVVEREQPALPAPRPAVVEVVHETMPVRVIRVIARPAVFDSKGPRPAVTSARTEAPQVGLPAAFLALRTVAERASSDWGVQRAMEKAGEPFQTLDSEAAAERRVAALPVGGAGNISGAGTDLQRELPKPAPGVTPPVQDSSGGQPKHPSAPVREGASLNVGSFA